MSALRKKIEDRLKELEDLLDNNIHLEDDEQVLELIQSISKFWSVLEEGDRDYIDAARYACEFKKVWK
jgi:Holliday junction resolvase RusA-like endonuclease